MEKVEEKILRELQILEDNYNNSIFNSRSLEDIINEIVDVYIFDTRPWILGFSGGKDSTTTLQLVWSAIEVVYKKFPEKIKPLYIIASDTLVETPIIANHLKKQLELLEKASKNSNLGIQIVKVVPAQNDTFWVNLIGRGYPAPTNLFRWCTDRMKIRPANKFIIDTASEFGEVIVVLGVRKQESMTRAQIMSLHKKPESLLSTHSSIPAAYVYTPIEDFTTDDIWSYLREEQSPVGFDNNELFKMYKDATGECPLVIDKSTPSCGNSRFGCWTCTVVKEDKSLNAQINSGQQWLKPMLEFRNFLAMTQEVENRDKYRSHKRRNGKVTKLTKNGEGHYVPGPYEPWFRKELLEKLLK
ncbi:MAG: DNA phosphorothioation system sulfurtransferase DndC, partial [Candidatus Heimdallarchaeota archaeon]|nr:DNA phosphorothioation system sulfurtransferase DndC [Candidatus Heimdallarchaeota archaeon]